MKKYNFVTFVFLCLLVIAVTMFSFFKNNIFGTAEKGNIDVSTTKNKAVAVVDKPTENTLSHNANRETESELTSFTQAVPKSDISMDDALFIGDSRTVGLMEYSGIDGADFFCTVGMSVYNIHNNPVSVPNIGKIALTDLLNSKKYGKIYIMLGINEVGYDFDRTVEKYAELIDMIKNAQPNAVVFIQANLHVSKNRSDSDEVINNTAIDELNEKLSKLADGNSVFYLDANVLFDDDTGSLSSEKTEDSTHLYAKYYKEWGNWIVMQTSSLIEEG